MGQISQAQNAILEIAFLSAGLLIYITLIGTASMSSKCILIYMYDVIFLTFGELYALLSPVECMSI